MRQYVIYIIRYFYLSVFGQQTFQPQTRLYLMHYKYDGVIVNFPTDHLSFFGCVRSRGITPGMLFQINFTFNLFLVWHFDISHTAVIYFLFHFKIEEEKSVLSKGERPFTPNNTLALFYLYFTRDRYTFK